MAIKGNRLNVIGSKTDSEIRGLITSVNGAIYFASDKGNIYLGTGGKVKLYGGDGSGGTVILPDLLERNVWYGDNGDQAVNIILAVAIATEMGIISNITDIGLNNTFAINVDGDLKNFKWSDLVSGISIIANTGIGLDADKPVTGLTIGDIYVSNDTFKKYTAISSTTWNNGVTLLKNQFITDSIDNNKLYQYNGSGLIVISGGVSVNDKGWFADETALTTAYPTGQNGWYATVGTTDTIWVWDSDTTSWVDSGSQYSGFASETHAAISKTTPVDADELGIVDSAASWVIKKLTWANLKATLAQLFETKSNLAGGTTGQVFTKNSNTNNDYTWADTVVGGHEIRDNGVPLVQRAGLNFLGLTISDDAVNDETDVEAKFEGLTDVDLTGKQDGDVLQYNATSTKIEPQSTALFNDITRSIEANISADGQLSTVIDAGYSIVGIRIVADTNAILETIKIGTTSIGSEIAEFISSASFDNVINIKKRFISNVNDTALFISGITAGVYSIYFTFIKGGVSDKLNKIYQILTSSATITMDINNGVNAKLTMAHNVTLTLSNLANGSEGNIILTQDATGSRTITIASDYVIDGGAGVITLTGTANSIDILSYTYDGTRLFITIGKNYTNI